MTSQEPQVRTSGRLPLAAMLLALGAGAPAGPVAGQEIDAHAEVSWRSFATGDQTSDGLHQEYRLGLMEAFTEVIRLDLSMRVEDSRNNVRTGDLESSTSFLQLRPAGELLLTYPRLQLQGVFDLADTSFSGDGPPDRRLEHEGLRLMWQPEGLVDVALTAERNVATDEARTLDLNEQWFQATLSKAFGPFEVSASGRAMTQEDGVMGVMRDTRQGQARAAFNQTYFGGRLATSASMDFILSSFEDSATAEGGTIEQQIRIAAVASGIDDTPDDSRDAPSLPAPGLIDGLFLSTGIPLGPTAPSFRNIAFDLGLFTSVAELHLIVRDPSGNLLQTAGPIDWTVFVSTNQLDWREIGGSSSRFDSVRSRYDVEFPEIETRFIKVVSFGVNIVDTELVEVQAFEHIGVPPGGLVNSDQQVLSGTATVSGSPTDWSSVSYTGLFNASTLEREGEPTLDTDDNSHFASAQVRPAHWTDVTLSYIRTKASQTNGTGQALEQMTGEWHLTPRQRLGGTLQVFRSKTDTGGSRVNTDGMALIGTARMWRAIDLTLDVGQDWSDLLDRDLSVTNRHLNGLAIVRLTRTFRLTTTLGWTEVDAGLPLDTDEFGVNDERRWSAELNWNPGPPLEITGKVGRSSSRLFSADIRTLSVRWEPFSNGALRLSSLYDMDVDTRGRRTLHRLLLSAGWRINRITSLDASYNIFEVTGAEAVGARSLLATFTLDL